MHICFFSKSPLWELFNLVLAMLATTVQAAFSAGLSGARKRIALHAGLSGARKRIATSRASSGAQKRIALHAGLSGARKRIATGRASRFIAESTLIPHLRCLFVT